MSKNNQMSSFLAELAGEATQKIEAERLQEQLLEEMKRTVHAALERAAQFFELFTSHLNTIGPDIPRIYVLDGKTQFSQLKWKSGHTDYRRKSLDDGALLDYVLLQIKLTVPEPVLLTRRWVYFQETRDELHAFGLQPQEDLDELWKNPPQNEYFQLTLVPWFSIRTVFQSDYAEGNVYISCNNLEGFGAVMFKVKPEDVQPALLDDIGRYLMGRALTLPQKLVATRSKYRNL